MDNLYINDVRHGEGDVVDLKQIPKEQIPSLLKRFSEGSSALEQCLITANSIGLETIACCKGDHISLTKHIIDNEVKDSYSLESDAYIAFRPDCGWQDYLSLEILEDKDVTIDEMGIHYYGENHDNFFRLLTRDFLAGKRNNKYQVSKKMKETTRERVSKLQMKSYRRSLHKLGFSESKIDLLINLIKTHISLEKELFFTESNDQTKEPDKDLLNLYHYVYNERVKYFNKCVNEILMVETETNKLN